MTDWVKEGYDSLVQNQEMVKKFFEVCGISSTDTGEVRNGDFFKQCMEKALQNLEAVRAMTLMKILSNCTISRPS